MASGPVVNIRRDVDDKFYRYKMPVLITKIEGKGNGIKTVVPNMSDVARALSRPPIYTTKFFGCELGAQTSFDEKSERYIVNGAHDASRLRELLDVFIDKFVLCASCKNPETELVILTTAITTTTKEGGNIVRHCKACGLCTEVDMRHKLVTFILKNPPKKIAGKRRKRGGETAERNIGGSESPARTGTPECASGASDDDELAKKIKAEAAELDTQAMRVNDGWFGDASHEGIKARRMKDLERGTKHVTLSNDERDEDGDSPFAQLALWAMAYRESATPVEVYKKAQELCIEKRHKTVQILVQSLFTENIVKEIPKFTPLFKRLATSERHQKSLLGGIERAVGIEQTSLISAVPKILMAFYQADVLEEDVIKQWGTHVSKKYVDRDVSKRVRKASEPFLKWLQEAEDDESN